MSIFIQRVDSVPLQNTNFPFELDQWLANLADSLNTSFEQIQNAFNLLTAQSYTAAQLADTDFTATLSNGIILYDSTNHVYVGKQNGAMVQFDTSPYP
jgi:flagellar basal body P-ring protein FlgI